MIPDDKKKKIETIWECYINSDQRVLDTKGIELPNIDQSRKKLLFRLRNSLKLSLLANQIFTNSRLLLIALTNGTTFGALQQPKDRCFLIS